jgi:hypothetical protein
MADLATIPILSFFLVALSGAERLLWSRSLSKGASRRLFGNKDL